MIKTLIVIQMLFGSVVTMAGTGTLTSSTMQIQYDQEGREVFVYTCVYSDGRVLQGMPNCPFTD